MKQLTPKQRARIYKQVANLIEYEVRKDLEIYAEDFTSLSNEAPGWYYCCSELQEMLRDHLSLQFNRDSPEGSLWDMTNFTTKKYGIDGRKNLDHWFPEFALFRPKRADAETSWWGQRYCDQETRVAVLRLCAEMALDAA